MRPEPNPTLRLFAAVVAYLRECYPGEAADSITIRLRDPHRPAIKMPVPLTLPVDERQSEPFVPNEFQARILAALDGRAFRTDALAAEVGCDRRSLFRPGGISELKEAGLVASHPRLGYYAPATPPEQLSEQS